MKRLQILIFVILLSLIPHSVRAQDEDYRSLRLHGYTNFYQVRIKDRRLGVNPEIEYRTFAPLATDYSHIIGAGHVNLPVFHVVTIEVKDSPNSPWRQYWGVVHAGFLHNDSNLFDLDLRFDIYSYDVLLPVVEA